jgi:hypothetical protein
MMVLKTLRNRFLLIAGMAVLIGCASTAPSAGSPSPPVTREPSITTATSPDATPPPSDDPSPLAEPSAAGSVGPSVGLRTDWIAETIVDRVRMRSLPEIDDRSIKYEPLLRTGTRLFVLDGPVAGSGYAWSQVVPIWSEGGPPTPRESGWVAVAGRDGEPWLRDAKLDCPEQIGWGDFAAIVKLGGAGGLSCYGSTELSFLATVLMNSGCITDGGGSPLPDWLAGQNRAEYAFAAPWLEPAVLQPASEDCFPDIDLIGPAFHPDSFENPVGDLPLTSGSMYQVTAHYDDSAAATCIEPDPEFAGDRTALVTSCRMTLVVTRIEPFAGIDEG